MKRNATFFIKRVAVATEFSPGGKNSQLFKLLIFKKVVPNFLLIIHSFITLQIFSREMIVSFYNCNLKFYFDSFSWIADIILIYALFRNCPSNTIHYNIIIHIIYGCILRIDYDRYRSFHFGHAFLSTHICFWSENFFRHTMHSKSPVVNLAEHSWNTFWTSE